MEKMIATVSRELTISLSLKWLLQRWGPGLKPCSQLSSPNSLWCVKTAVSQSQSAISLQLNGITLASHM